jgi:hypothetical protein
MYSVRFEKRFQRSNFSAAFGETALNRLTCNIWQGVCSEDLLAAELHRELHRDVHAGGNAVLGHRPLLRR